MNAETTTQMAPEENATPWLCRHWPLWVWGVVLLLVNFPLLRGEVNTSLIFIPETLEWGQWWRVITYPLVHLSWYHLLLDASGFLLLFSCLEERRYLPRALYLLGSSAGALLLTLAMAPSVGQNGLSGLSGVAHGLMAIAALEMIGQREQRVWGWVSLLSVVGKSAYELYSGQVLFEFIHMGMCGQPMAASHAGGVMGALLTYAILLVWPGSQNSHDRPSQQTLNFDGHRAWYQAILIMAIRLMTRTMYRVRYKGLEHIPEKGAAVLVCNHVTYIDWLIIASACRRPVHFVMHASIYRKPLLNWILRLAKVIPIESGRKNPAALRKAFAEIDHILERGGLVCIFPEGRLTHTGRIDRFRPGIERIVARRPTPVIPLALNGLWGSFFSHKNGPAMRCLPRSIWAPVELTIGQGVQPRMVTAHHLRCTVQKLHGGMA